MTQPILDTPADYQAKRATLVAAMKALPPGSVALQKRTSNLFRQRGARVQRLDVRTMNRVIKVDAARLIAEVEAMTTYEDLVAATLQQGLLPTVVPELKTITIGGATAGGGIESSSFKYGLVHETILEMEVLLSSGEVVTASPTEHPDLFYGLPNTFGTLGYVLKLTVQLVPTKPYVHLRHIKFNNAKKLFTAIEQVGQSGKYEGQMVDIYYQSGRAGGEDYLTIADYIWRWDPDWFWCSRAFLAENKLVRLLAGKWLLHSRTYWKLVGLDRKYKVQAKLDRLTGKPGQAEAVIQDVQVTMDQAPAFLEFLHDKIGILPIWICPTKVLDPKAHFAFYPLDSQDLHINFGFWSTVRTQFDPKDGHYNRLIERELIKAHGYKGLYSDAFYTPDEFWQIYDHTTYQELKATYDPESKLKDLYQKTVGRA
jgi:FAD/FMN-containing dehydrogenase